MSTLLFLGLGLLFLFQLGRSATPAAERTSWRRLTWAAAGRLVLRGVRAVPQLGHPRVPLG